MNNSLTSDWIPLLKHFAVSYWSNFAPTQNWKYFAQHHYPNDKNSKKIQNFGLFFLQVTWIVPTLTCNIKQNEPPVQMTNTDDKFANNFCVKL